MGKVNFIVIGMVIISLILFFLAYRVKIKKNLQSIPMMNEERLKKIKKVDKVCNDFGNRLILMAVSALLAAILTYFFGKMGKIVGIIIFILVVLSWSNLCGQIDENIKKHVY